MRIPETSDSQKPNQANENQTTEVDYEKRYKDTQSAYTKSQVELKATKAKLEALEKITQPSIELDENTKQELDALKFSDPDAWRAKMNQLENEAKIKHKQTLDNATQEALQVFESENRSQVLAAFNMSHKLNLTQETLDLDVPRRIAVKLENGEISYEQYLVEAAEFLKTPKAIGTNTETMKQPNLSNVGGDNTPTDGAVNKDIAANYSNIVF